MGGGDHIWTRRVDLRVDHERRAIERPVALDDLAQIVHEDEVLDPDVLEVHPQRVHPEMVEAFGIACGDVSGDALVEPETTEQPKRGGEALLAMPALVLGACVLRKRVREST